MVREIAATQDREDVLQTLRRVAVPLLAPYARRIALFGSVARGDHRPDSDLDLLVELRPPSERPTLGLLQLAALERQLSLALGRPVDLVTSVSPHVRERIRKDMVIIYEQ